MFLRGRCRKDFRKNSVLGRLAIRAEEPLQTRFARLRARSGLCRVPSGRGRRAEFRERASRLPGDSCRFAFAAARGHGADRRHGAVRAQLEIVHGPRLVLLAQQVQDRDCEIRERRHAHRQRRAWWLTVATTSSVILSSSVAHPLYLVVEWTVLSLGNISLRT